jgi:hypothetical protein
MTRAVEEEQHIQPNRRPYSRRRRAALAGTAVLVVVGSGLWFERRPILRHFVTDTLVRRGVPARYDIADLGLGRQRLTHVVIGDPARPDLVADWIETRTDIGLSGVSVQQVRAGHVRLRAELRDGKLRLGALDRLMPPSSGNRPFALPRLSVDVADARIRLTTPAGLVGIKLRGKGRLDNGFRGTLAAVAPDLRLAGCAVTNLSAAVDVRIDRARPELVGPVRVGRLACADTRVADLRADLSVDLSAALDRWQGDARLTSAAVEAKGVTLAAMRGRLDFTGDASGTGGRADLHGTGLHMEQARAATVRLYTRYAIGPDGVSGKGVVDAQDAALAPAMLARLDGIPALAGTPLAPLRDRLVMASRAAAGRFDLHLPFAAELQGGTGAVTLGAGRIDAATGARLALTEGALGYRWPTGGLHLDGRVTSSGGGLPELAIMARRRARDGRLTGTATLRAAYEAGNASLAATPLNFALGGRGETRLATDLRLTGPLGDNGRIEDLRLPLAVRRTRGGWQVEPGCVPVGWRRLSISSLTLDPARLNLCPTGGTLLAVADGRVAGDARLAATALRGRIGRTPLAIDAAGARFDVATQDFTLDDVKARLGEADRPTRIDATTLTGRIANGAIAGTFTGGAGQIGAVPLLLSDATGDWRFRGGVLDLDGALTVTDAQTDAPRFKPMAGRGVTLRLAGNRIDAAGTLYEPTTNIAVANVALHHLLDSGTGAADLTVPGLVFTKTFRPDLLTPLTFGVIADVKGKVTGAGHIAWGDQVTSTGAFTSQGIDLAAAFGPATGIAGTIRFDDLLALHTPPGQVVTVKTVNPGVAVNDGVIRFQLLGGVRVQVEDARWPFAGGALTLDPTLLDFAAERARRMTFHVSGARADQFLQQFDFPNLDATGIFDGTLPMIFDDRGGRIEGGRLVVRDGGGTLAYVGVLGQKQLGTWGNLAFQALKSLRYRSLTINMDGPLGGDMVTAVRFTGVQQGQGAKSNFIIRRLQQLPFTFNIRIRAPFRGLLDSVSTFYDPKLLVERNLPALIEAQKRKAENTGSAPAKATPPLSIQTPVSENRR